MPIPFKPYLKEKSSYKGGKSKAEVVFNGTKLYKLSSNENQLGSSPKALAAIQKHLNNLSEYPDRTDKRLRAALATFYNNQLTAAQFVTTNSGVANIELIIRGFMEEGTECIYSSPAFGPYKGFPKKLGAKGIDVPLIGVDFQLDVEGILNAINENTRLIFVTNPNNPTGTFLPKSQIDALVAHLPDHVILVYDEVYYHFVDQVSYTQALPYVLAGKNVIGVNSFSKAYGLAGLRVGYSYTTPEITSYLQQLRRPFMINTLSMEAAIAALEDDEFIEQTVQMVKEEKAFLYPKLDALGCKYWKSEANFIFIQPEMSGKEFEAFMLKEGIMVRPAKGLNGSDGVRVTIGTREANEAFIAALKRIE